jgi:hypothetical protein
MEGIQAVQGRNEDINTVRNEEWMGAGWMSDRKDGRTEGRKVGR